MPSLSEPRAALARLWSALRTQVRHRAGSVKCHSGSRPYSITSSARAGRHGCNALVKPTPVLGQVSDEANHSGRKRASV